jgi:Ca2+-binding RTX toxin-like protein
MQVHFSIDGTSVPNTAIANSDGTWSSMPSGLADGEHTVVASETDAAGNSSMASFTFTLDTSVSAPNLALQSDSGSSSSDHITNVGTVEIGGLESGASWEYSTDNGASWTAGSGTNFTLAGDGPKDVLLHQIDLAGNVSSDASSSFILDTIAPNDVINSVVLKKDGTFTLTGTAEPNSLINIYDGATPLGSTTPDGTGQWSFTTGVLSSSVAHNFNSTARDLAGNVGSSGSAIYGTKAADVLTSTSENDILTGAAGGDTFVFNAGFGEDVITDFLARGKNHDILEFDYSVFASATDALAHAVQAGPDVVIRDDAGDVVTLLGVRLQQLSESDFHIV